MTREIPLSRGLVALVDDEDYAALSAYRWVATPERGANTVYAIHNFTLNGKRCVLWMHRMLVDAEAHQVVDHINGDGLDNRRANLRPCSNQQNMQNRRAHSSNKTGLKGVYPDGARFRSVIMVDGRQRQIGGFPTATQAARAYDLAATKHFGEFARLNFSPRRDWLFPHEHAGRWPPTN